MGLLQRIGQTLGLGQTGIASWERPDGILETVTMEALYGDVSDVYVSRRSAIGLPVVSKARRSLCTTIGRLPLVAFDREGRRWPDGTFSLLQQPEQGRPLSATLWWTIDSLFFHGVAYWHVVRRDSYGWPAQVRLVPFGDAETDDDGALVSVAGEPITAGDFIRFDGFDAGLLHDAADTIRRAMILNRVAGHAEDNPVPSIDLHNTGEDLAPEQIDALIARWKTARRNGGIGYTSKGMEAKTLGQRPEQLLIDSRKRIDLELSRSTGAPAWVTDVPLEGASLNYQNRASRNWELIDLFASPYMSVIEDRLALGDVTPRGTRVSFETDELVRPDMKTRFDTYEVGMRAGFITQDWINAQEAWT